VEVPAARIVFTDADRAEIAAGVAEMLGTGALTLGPHTRAFEEQFAAAQGVEHAIAVSSGTAALEIALRSLDVAGGEVIVPANTFYATAGAVAHAGARPVFADIDPDTFALTPDTVAAVATPQTKAVVVVHIGGLVAPSTPALAAWCQERGVPLVEDAAHAHGSSLAGIPAGGFGTVATFSFYPTKVITSGEGGMITTSDQRLVDEAKVYRDQGKAGFLTNAHTRLGYAWRLSELHALTGLVHLRHLPEFLARRQEVAARYDKGLAGSALTPLPAPQDGVTNSYKYLAWLPNGVDRAAVKKELRADWGVAMSGEVYELPLHLQTVFADLPRGPLPVAEDACARHVCLPLHSDMRDDEVEQVLEAVTAVVGAHAERAGS
jgi:perosamine synthetase